MTEDRATEKVFTREDLQRVVQATTQQLNNDIEVLARKLRDTEFRACLAEWAIAGVLSQNLHLSVKFDGDQKQSDALETARYIGKSAGSQFLHAAGLAFKEHAKHSELMSKTPPYEQYKHISAPFDRAKSTWPRAFE